MKIIECDGEYIIMLTGSEMRQLERSGEVKKKNFTVIMDFGEGEELYRTNQVNPSHLKEEKW